ncbi:DUF2637 domain-containing protein [Arthrobacter woluwensis]|nr:DUF2637 domain-containing protein [Arthrobacter woluwensis]
MPGDRINPDSPRTLWFTVALVAFLAVASFMVSFAGLHEVATWAGLPSWLRWAVPVFVDVAILAYTLSVLIHRHRGEATWPSWVALSGFTVLSVIANAAHALSVTHENLLQAIVGAGVAAMAPVAVFAATEELGRLIIRHAHPAADEHETVLQEVQPVATPARQIEASLVTEPHPEEGPSSESPASAEDPRVGEDPIFQELKETSTVPAEEVQPPQQETAEPTRASLEVVGGSRKKPLDLATWVLMEEEAGRIPTGAGAAKFLGVSARTGRRRLDELKKSRPELFAEDPAATSGVSGR